MTEQEINRAVQYVTAATSYGRETVEVIVRTCLAELEALADSSTQVFTRESLMEYVCRWTITQSRESEPLVREVLGCAGRWLDEVYREVAAHRPGTDDSSEDEGEGMSAG